MSNPADGYEVRGATPGGLQILPSGMPLHSAAEFATTLTESSAATESVEHELLLALLARQGCPAERVDVAVVIEGERFEYGVVLGDLGAVKRFSSLVAVAVAE